MLRDIARLALSNPGGPSGPGAVWRRRAPRRAAALFLLLAAAVTAAAPAVRAEGPWSTGWLDGQPSNSVTAIAAHPSDPALAYLGTGAGLYRTSNGGASWTVLSGALANPSALVVAPGVPRTLYTYAEPKGGGGRAALWRSDDGGQSWSSPLAGGAIDALAGLGALLVDRESRETLLAGTGRGALGYGRIWKSTDGGAHWREVHAVRSEFGVGEITALAQAPADRRVLYAGHTIYHGGSLLGSYDGGESWSPLPQPSLPLFYPAALAVAPDNPRLLYVAFQAPTGSGVRLYSSRDGGQSWNRLELGLPVGPADSPLLQIDAQDGRRLLFSLRGEGAGVYASFDRGASWAPLGDAPPPLRRISALALAASGRLLYAGTGEGVWQYALPLAPAWGPDDRFAEYYRQHDGLRVLGRPISGPVVVGSYYAQYFEKGRLEDHSAETTEEKWRFMYGLLVDQLQQKQASGYVGGDLSTVTYATIARFARPESRVAPPAGFQGGVAPKPDGSVFVPFSAALRPEAGHSVAPRFWSHINRPDLFPGGWLHDVGLPITEPLSAVVDKGDVRGRSILVQAFQRTVLTDDPLNPPGWQVERANAGTDYLRAAGEP